MVPGGFGRAGNGNAFKDNGGGRFDRRGGAGRLRQRRRARNGGAARRGRLHAAAGGHAGEAGEASGAAAEHHYLRPAQEGQRLYLRRRSRVQLRLRRQRRRLPAVPAPAKRQQYRANAADDGVAERRGGGGLGRRLGPGGPILVLIGGSSPFALTRRCSEEDALLSALAES